MEDNLPKESILSHIAELRKRLLISVIALAVTTMASFAFCQQLADFLAKPIGGLSVLEAIDVTENISSFMKISLLSGVILALPIILYEILAFVMPGLNPDEKKWIWMVIPSVTIFFTSGVAFAYFFMLPTALPFLLSFMGINTTPRPNNYFSFVTNLMFWVGISFEIPVVMYILARLKIISAKILIKQWRVAILASAIMAALITPTADPVNMGLMMLPLFALYLLSIIFAAFARRERKEKTRKRLSKRARIIILIIIILMAIGLVAVYYCLPTTARIITDPVAQFFMNLWKTVSIWPAKIGQAIYKIMH
jgi:sec-independent protein translocase protein TatC